MTTVAELKKLIADLPDETVVLARLWRYAGEGREELWGPVTEAQVERLVPVGGTSRWIVLKDIPVDDEFADDKEALSEFEAIAETCVVLSPGFSPDEARGFFNN